MLFLYVSVAIIRNFNDRDVFMCQLLLLEILMIGIHE